jgi:hypothetical protein
MCIVTFKQKHPIPGSKGALVIAFKLQTKLNLLSLLATRLMALGCACLWALRKFGWCTITNTTVQTFYIRTYLTNCATEVI